MVAPAGLRGCSKSRLYVENDYNHFLREPMNSPCRLESRLNRYGVLDIVHCCSLIGMNIRVQWLEAFSQMKTSFAMYSFIYNFLYSLGPKLDTCSMSCGRTAGGYEVRALETVARYSNAAILTLCLLPAAFSLIDIIICNVQSRFHDTLKSFSFFRRGGRRNRIVCPGILTML